MRGIIQLRLQGGCKSMADRIDGHLYARSVRPLPERANSVTRRPKRIREDADKRGEICAPADRRGGRRKRPL